jgi:hypothetical protein
MLVLARTVVTVFVPCCSLADAVRRIALPEASRLVQLGVVAPLAVFFDPLPVIDPFVTVALSPGGPPEQLLSVPFALTASDADFAAVVPFVCRPGLNVTVPVSVHCNASDGLAGTVVVVVVPPTTVVTVVWPPVVDVDGVPTCVVVSVLLGTGHLTGTSPKLPTFAVVSTSTALIVTTLPSAPAVICAASFGGTR